MSSAKVSTAKKADDSFLSAKDTTEPPKPGEDEEVWLQAQMKLSEKPRSKKPKKGWKIILEKLCCQCDCEGTLNREAGNAHFLITDKRVVVRYSDIEENSIKTPIYYCCFCFSGNCCCPKQWRQHDVNEYAFALSEIKDLKCKTSQTDVHSIGCLCCCCTNDITIDGVEVSLSVVTRYGELIPEEDWTISRDFQKTYRKFIFKGQMDQNAASTMRNIFAKQTAENRNGIHDPEKHAAPRPGIGGNAAKK